MTQKKNYYKQSRQDEMEEVTLAQLLRMTKAEKKAFATRKQQQREAERAVSQQQYDKAVHEAERWALTNSLPALQGTVKQIAYAQVIRYNWLHKRVNSKYQQKQFLQIVTESQLEAFLSLLRKEQDSTWWIVTNGEYGHPRKYLQHMMDSEPAFVFKIAFEEVDLARIASSPIADS
jgi:hypothetical protein